MNRDFNQEEVEEEERSGRPSPEEVDRFVEAVLGRKPTPTDPEVKAREDRKFLEWAAKISTRHEQELRDLERKEEAERKNANLSRWVDSVMGVEEAQWDPSQHPRAPKGESDGGQWISTGGGSGGARSSHLHTASDSERVITRIKLSSGNAWSGDRVMSVMDTLAPGWVPFVKQHVTLALTSGGAKAPVTTVRLGEFGQDINKPPKTSLNKPGQITIHFEIPTDWNDVQVVQYMLSQIVDDIDVHRLAANWATNKPDLFGQITNQRFKNGLSTVAVLARSYYMALAALTPGGQAAVAVWDIQNGDKLAAALDVAFLLPLGAIAQKGIEATGAIAIHAGDKLIAILPATVIEQLAKLAPEQKNLLHTRLLTAKTEHEAAGIVEKFLGTTFEAHHPLPMFLGGNTKQLLAKIPESIHDEFHALLRKELRAEGLNLRIGSPEGSAGKWREHFEKYSGTQGRAFNAVLKVSRAIDAKHGTNVTQWVWKNLVGKNVIFIP